MVHAEPNSMLLLTFNLDDRRFALHIESVEKVLRAVEITPLADAPRNVLGLINVYGRVIPVFNLRARFSLPVKEIDPDDKLIIARTGGKPVALLVDGIGGVEECAMDLETKAATFLPGMEQTDGIARLGEEMVVIEDLDRLCSHILSPASEANAG
jgi:purine-binding chemotaxis protein CheW